MSIRPYAIFVSLLSIGVLSAPVCGDMIVSEKQLGWTGWGRNRDLSSYDPATGTSAPLFDEYPFGRRENIDALHAMADGSLVVSLATRAVLGGACFDGGDLIAYDPNAGTFDLFFDGGAFGRNEDIDAAYVFDTGEIALSTTGAASLGGLNFQSGDVVKYDPVSGVASLLFDHSLFGHQEDVDAFHVTAAGEFILSTTSGGRLGEATFSDHDLIRFNPATGGAHVIDTIDGRGRGIKGLFKDIDAVSFNAGGGGGVVPEPATMSLAALGGLMLITRRLRRR